jgi:hypothetical protein
MIGRFRPSGECRDISREFCECALLRGVPFVRRSVTLARRADHQRLREPQISMPRLHRRARAGLEFLRVAALLSGEEKPMLDLALFAGFVLLCLYIAYERLSNRL